MDFLQQLNNSFLCSLKRISSELIYNLSTFSRLLTLMFLSTFHLNNLRQYFQTGFQDSLWLLGDPEVVWCVGHSGLFRMILCTFKCSNVSNERRQLVFTVISHNLGKHQASQNGIKQGPYYFQFILGIYRQSPILSLLG